MIINSTGGEIYPRLISPALPSSVSAVSYFEMLSSSRVSNITHKSLIEYLTVPGIHFERASLSVSVQIWHFLHAVCNLTAPQRHRDSDGEEYNEAVL